jgi:hypothetical protein
VIEERLHPNYITYIEDVCKILNSIVSSLLFRLQSLSLSFSCSLSVLIIAGSKCVGPKREQGRQSRLDLIRIENDNDDENESDFGEGEQK